MARAPRKNANPEHKLQVQVRQYLMTALPPSIEWTANAAGVRVSIHAAKKMKAAGVRRGWPDLQFLFPDGVTRFVELKTPTGSLSPEQRDFRDRCLRIRPPVDIWALARSVEDVAAALAGWGVELRESMFHPEANAAARAAWKQRMAA